MKTRCRVCQQSISDHVKLSHKRNSYVATKAATINIKFDVNYLNDCKCST